MRSRVVDEGSRLSLWAQVREFAVPRSMIEAATARRLTGDWAGACAAAWVDVDLNLRAVGRSHGVELAAVIRRDLRQLVPDLLRWHFPRVGPDGLLRPGLTVSLARYPPDARGGAGIHLVARTPPAWAGGGQRISLALWAESGELGGAGGHPHPRPDRRFRLDLHRHLWDARRVGELWERSGAAEWFADRDPDLRIRCAAGRWHAEAELLLRAEGRSSGSVVVRLSSQRRLVLNLDRPDEPAIAAARSRTLPRTWPILPDAATWIPSDLELLRAGLIDGDRLHPLVALALVPDHRPADGSRASSGTSRTIQCRGATHRIAVADGVLVPLDHDEDEIRREQLLVALGGTALPCLQAIDESHRRPERLAEVRARLHHGDAAGALAAVEDLLGPNAQLRDGELLDELELAVRRRAAHSLYRAGLAGIGPLPSRRDRRSAFRAHPRHTSRR